VSVVPLHKPSPILDHRAMTLAAGELYKRGGLPRGQSTGWSGLDEFYTVLPGQWTVITGTPGSGKSEFLDAMLVNLAEANPDWEFALYSPENYPPETHLVKLIEKHERKPFGQGPTERMTMVDVGLGAQWVHEHFFWLEPDLKAPDELIATGLSCRREGKQFGIVLDPWNTLDHQRGTMNETDYVSFILTEVTKLARSCNAHIWLVVHPAKIYKNKDGVRPVPTPYDISGSAHWYNKADNIITVHRNQAERTQDVEIHVQKIRFKHVGRVGLSVLKYDRVTGRYFEFPNGLAGEFYADPERR
jgi:twinkle protein